MVLMNDHLQYFWPRAGSRVVRIDPLRFLAGFHTPVARYSLFVLKVPLNTN